MTATVAPPATPFDPSTSTTGALPTSARASSSATLAGRERRERLVDAGGAMVLALLAVAGLSSVFDGIGPLIIGGVAAAAAVGVVALIERFALRGFVALGIVVVAFVLAGGVAVPDHAIAGFLPGPGSPGALLDGLVSSWKDLVTTAPPVGTGGGMGVVPYVIGWVSAGLGFAFARRTRATLLPAAPAAIGVVASIVVGDRDPWSVAIQGGVFAAVALGWGSLRANRTRRSLGAELNWGRFAGAITMLVAVVASSVLLVDHGLMPGVDTTDRHIAREEVIPPFDPRDYPSPLASFRRYSIGEDEKKVLFTVDGLPKGTRIRLSTMDQYDGVVWTVGGTDSESGRFRRVGSEILPVPDGRSANLGVEVGDYQGVWIPEAGTIRQLRFQGSRSDDLEAAFRYNSDTGVAATPIALKSGDRYSVDVRLTGADTDAAKAASVDSSAPSRGPTLSDKALKAINGAVSSASTPYEQAKALEQYFAKEGFYSAGRKEDTGASFSAPGHSLARLDKPFLSADQMVGDAEQYAAAMALAARTLGLPSRVVFGFTPAVSGSTTEVKGSDVDAWVDIKFDGVGWVPFYPTPPENQRPPDTPKQKPKEEDLAQQPPQNEQRLDAPDDAPDLSKKVKPPPPPPPPKDGIALPAPLKYALIAVGVPGLLFGLYAGIVLALKRFRRQRRRERGSLVARASGAWAEAVDQARDRGARWPRNLTRSEVAREVAAGTWSEAPGFASSVDDAMFGPYDPTPEVVDDLWRQADGARSSMLDGLTWRDRWKARLSVRSLRPL